MPDAIPPPSPPADADGFLRRAILHMRPGWLLLNDCGLGGETAGGRQVVRYGLIHPEVGIALLDIAPDNLPDAVALCRRRLDEARFVPMFGGYPPVVYRTLPMEHLPRLADVLDFAFARESPLALRRGTAWVRVAGRVLLAKADRRGGGLATGTDGAGMTRWPLSGGAAGRATGRRVTAAAGWPGRRVLLGFWGVLVVTVGVGAAVLEHLGPPAPPAGRGGVVGGGPAPAPDGLTAAAPERMTPPAARFAAIAEEPAETPAPADVATGIDDPPPEELDEPPVDTADAAPAGDAGVAMPAAPVTAAGAAVEAAGPAAMPVPVIAAAVRPIGEARFGRVSESGSGGTPPAAAEPRGSPVSVATTPGGDVAAGRPLPLIATSAPAQSRVAAAMGSPRMGGARTDRQERLSIAASPPAPPAMDRDSGSGGGDGADAPRLLGDVASSAAPAPPSAGGGGSGTDATPPSAVPAEPAGARDVPSRTITLTRGGGNTPRTAPAEGVDPPARPPSSGPPRSAAPGPMGDRPSYGAPVLAAPEATPPPSGEAAGQPAVRLTGWPAAVVPSPPLPPAAQPAAVPALSAAGAALRPLPTATPMPPAMVAALVRRGDAMLALGDISAARLLYERAAAGGSGAAAAALGRTYDPAVLAVIGARGIRPDPGTAAAWYRRATTLGEDGAETLLRRLGAAGSDE